MGERIYQVDAFTDRLFAGNPAAVCLLSHSRDEGWMRSVAREMNLSETAFLRRQDDGYALRWFTPLVEVDLCGHATLASAHILWEIGLLATWEQARFFTRSGLLTARRREGEIEMDFPATPEDRVVAPPGLDDALGAPAQYVGRSKFDYLVELASEEIVRGLQPDMGRLRALDTRGLIVTAKADTPGYDFMSRFFAPGSGVDEDPVTGSAHCCLGPYWHKRLGKRSFLAYQASARGGVVRVTLADDRVILGGQAVTVLRGELVSE